MFVDELAADFLDYERTGGMLAKAQQRALTTMNQNV